MIRWLKKNNYVKKEIEIDKNYYSVYLKEKIYSPASLPRIVVVSYQPNSEASELLRLCIKSIKKFTSINYELWVVDNNSPDRFIKWIDEVEDINIAYIRTEPKGEASYANGIALEAASRLINPDTTYLICLHEDVVVCRYGWLDYMISKMDGRIKAAGFRLTTARVPEGVLHVCGYIIDFKVFKELNLSFLPELPQFDVGDKAIYILKKNDFDIFHTPNTFDSPDLIKLIPRTMEVHNLNVTRSFNDKNEVIYMHLGRGIPKVKGEYKNKEKSSSAQWSEYIKGNLLSEPLMHFVNLDKIDHYDFSDISIREFYILNFIKDNLNLLSDNSNVFYFGRENKYFNEKRLNIKYLTKLPFNNKRFDCVIFPEIIIDNIDSRDIVEWSLENLNSRGILLATIPFVSDVKYFHKSVIDKLWKKGFREVSLVDQGSHSSIKLQIDLEKLKVKTKSLKEEEAGIIINRSMRKKLKSVIKAENKLKIKKISKADNIVTGYGIKAVK